ncbi:MAG: CHAP domain-containing protein [bacterium]
MKIPKKILIKIIVLLILFAPYGGFAQAASLDDLLQQRNKLNQDLDSAQSAADNKGQEIKSLSTQIKNLDSDIKQTESKINETSGQVVTTTGEIEKLNKNVESKNAELKKLKSKLNNALVEVYRFSSRSNIELLLGGNTLGATSNEVRYVEAIEIQIKSMYSEVQSVKLALEKQKEDQEKKKQDLDDLKQRQEAYKNGAVYQKTQKDQLLGMTEQEKIAYENKVDKIRSEVAQISNEIYARRQAARGGEDLGGGSGYNYSCNNVDPWLFYTCQCTSYASWYWNAMLGKEWYNTRPGSGSAYNWPNLARDQGYSVSGSPRVGAIISWPGDGVYISKEYGHVAIVEAVNGDGTIDISEYNWSPLSFSRRRIDPGKYGSYSYIW